jgi:hypothetical protein
MSSNIPDTGPVSCAALAQNVVSRIAEATPPPHQLPHSPWRHAIPQPLGQHEAVLNFNVVVATHHKTGTVWMSTVFKAIARKLGATYVDFWSNYGRLERGLRSPFVLLNHDSTFLQHADILRRRDVRILHIIRDPRDVLISAMHYHKTSSEPWLHEAVPGNENVSYQQRLNALATPFEQFVFELENSTSSTIEAMLEWQYGSENCLEVRYEELWSDRSMALWSRILEFLGFDGREQELGRACFWEHSLFGEAGRANRRHARSGEVAQWKSEFTPELARAFVYHFPDALQVLGYETDERWIEELEKAATSTRDSMVG